MFNTGIKQVAMFAVEGEPVAKERPRLGKHGNTYTPSKTTNAETKIGWAFKQKARGWQADNTTAIALHITFIWSGVDKDIDNMVKTVMDGLNGVAYKDDKQVIRLQVSKIEGTQPETVVTVFAIPPDLSDV